MNANLELIKTLMIISFALGLFISALYFVGYTWDIINDFLKDYSGLSTIFFPFLHMIIFILSFIAIILLCQKLKSRKILIFFILWQIFGVVGIDGIKSSSDFESFLIPLILIFQSILLIAFSFFFFGALVKETNNELFFVVFLAYALAQFLGMIRGIMLMLDLKLDSSFGDIPCFANASFMVIYYILAIVAWSRFKILKMPHS